jgi:hypothetical protein
MVIRKKNFQISPLIMQKQTALLPITLDRLTALMGAGMATMTALNLVALMRLTTARRRVRAILRQKNIQRSPLILKMARMRTGIFGSAELM